jgi:hypothetical protein
MSYIIPSQSCRQDAHLEDQDKRELSQSKLEQNPEETCPVRQ